MLTEKKAFDWAIDWRLWFLAKLNDLEIER